MQTDVLGCPPRRLINYPVGMRDHDPWHHILDSLSGSGADVVICLVPQLPDPLEFDPGFPNTLIVRLFEKTDNPVVRTELRVVGTSPA